MSLKQKSCPSKKKPKLQQKNPYSKCRSNCAQHRFLFKPKQDSYYHSNVAIPYCPLYSERTDNYESILPQINADGKKYYPLFCIDLDKDHYAYHEEKYKEEHEKKVNDYVQQKKDLWEPKPGRKTKWCAVCKTHYEDYLDHVKDKQHSNNSKQNQYIKEIMKISKKFEQSKLQNQQPEIEPMFNDSKQISDDTQEYRTNNKDVIIIQDDMVDGQEAQQSQQTDNLLNPLSNNNINKTNSLQKQKIVQQQQQLSLQSQNQYNNFTNNLPTHNAFNNLYQQQTSKLSGKANQLSDEPYHNNNIQPYEQIYNNINNQILRNTPNPLSPQHFQQQQQQILSNNNNNYQYNQEQQQQQQQQQFSFNSQKILNQQQKKSNKRTSSQLYSDFNYKVQPPQDILSKKQYIDLTQDDKQENLQQLLQQQQYQQNNQQQMLPATTTTTQIRSEASPIGEFNDKWGAIQQNMNVLYTQHFQNNYYTYPQVVNQQELQTFGL